MSDHYIQITVEIGPIEPPHGLHIFDENGDAHNTVHGELAGRIFAAVSDIVHDAGLSAQVVSAADLGYDEIRTPAAADDFPAYQCDLCGATSHDPFDVARRFCGSCYRFLDGTSLG